MKRVIFIAAALLLLPFASAKAATIYFSPEQGDLNIGDIFTVDIKIDMDSTEECINTIEGVIGFDSSFLAAEDFSIGDSFLTLWLNKPGTGDMAEINSQKRLKFAGGTPGGYCGKIPGDDGNSNIVGKVVFRVVNAGVDGPNTTKTKVFFYPDTQALLNDGFGTQAKLVSRSAEFNVSKEKGGTRQEWDKLKTADNIPPESFTLELLKNPAIYEGKYYLVWNTTDKQTGIDHYEIQEIPLDANDSKEGSLWSSIKSLFGVRPPEAPWETVSQPYIIKDQALGSLIRIKAVDKAGNSQIAEYLPARTEASSNVLISKIGAGVVLLIVIIFVFLRIKRRKAKQ
jgi:hypothetical protein